MSILDKVLKGDRTFSDFRKNQKDPLSFPAYKATDVVKDFSPEAPEKAHNCIIDVDFSKNPKLDDFDTALMCLVVATSDGHRGTLSHLEIPNDVEQYNQSPAKFADRLQQHWKKGVPAIVVGGEDGDSTEFLNQLKIELQQRGFVLNLEHQESGGRQIYRRVTLYPDRIVVSTRPYSGKESSSEVPFRDQADTSH